MRTRRKEAGCAPARQKLQAAAEYSFGAQTRAGCFDPIEGCLHHIGGSGEPAVAHELSPVHGHERRAMAGIGEEERGHGIARRRRARC